MKASAFLSFYFGVKRYEKAEFSARDHGDGGRRRAFSRLWFSRKIHHHHAGGFAHCCGDPDPARRIVFEKTAAPPGGDRGEDFGLEQSQMFAAVLKAAVPGEKRRLTPLRREKMEVKRIALQGL